MPEARNSLAQPRDDIDGDLLDLLLLANQESGLVVRSAPVHKLGSFMGETADMKEFEAVLVDTHAVLKFLSHAGRIDSQTKANAEAYLGYVDKGWHFSSAIETSSHLYLDDLTVTYLDHVGLLEPLTDSVAAVYVENSVDEESKAILRYASFSDATLGELERIRATLNSAIEQGKITLTPRKDRPLRDNKKRGDLSAPSLEIMSDLSKVDMVAVDDRYLTKDTHWTDGIHRVLTASSFSILKALNSRGKLSQSAMWRSQHKLRKAGYCLTPIEPEELLSYVHAAPVNKSAIVETPELQAIRENISLAQRTSTFLLAETPWLVATRLAILQAIRAIWASGASQSDTMARADWLLYLMSTPLAWCTNPEDEGQWALACNQSAAQIALLLCFFDGKLARRQQYATWTDSRLVQHLRANQPWLLNQALELLKSYLERLISEDQK